LEVGQDDGPWVNPERLRKLNAILRYSQGDEKNGLTVTGMAYGSRWNATDQIAQRALDQGVVGRFGALDATDGGRSSRQSLSAQWMRSDANTSTRASAYVVHSDLKLYSDFTYFLNDPVNGDQFEQVDRRTVAGAQASHTWHSAFGGRDIEHTAGVQLRNDNVGEVGLFNTVARQRLSTVRDDSVRQTMTSAYYLNSITWTPWLRSLAGIRADRLDYRVASDNPLNSGRGSASLASPKIGLVFGPWSNVEYFFNAGYGFHSNDVRGATITVDAATGAPAQQVTPLVRAKGAEVGLRASFLKGVQTSLALWRLDIASELVFAGDAGTTEPSRASRRQGVEWSNYLKLARDLTGDFDVNLSRARFKENDPAGNYIPGAVETTASAGLTYLSGPWTGGLRLRYFGPRPLIEDNSQRSGSSLLVNAKAGYQLTKQLRAGMDILNLFDRKVDDITYFYESRLRGEAAGVLDKHFHPAEPRTLRVSLMVQF
ncbi:MAG: TonB-dependent receptor, partial [Clostridia bacterium]